MKKVYLVHGWGGSSQGGWFDWLKEKLKEKAMVKAFDMPETDTPRIKKWVGFLQKNVKVEDINEQTYFIGHSIGCQTILRFLEKLPSDIKIGGCVFVAGWFNLKNLEKEEDKIAEPWLKTQINFNKVKKHCDNFLAIFSDNDPYVPISDEKLFRKKLNAKILVKKKQGHFNEVNEIPEILEFLKVSK